MSANAEIELTWGDGEHRFRLAIGQLRELQDKCKCGPQEIADRLRLGTWRVDDIRETIRLGLIGGGKTPLEALTLVVRYVDGRPWAESTLVAFGIISAAIWGVPEDQPNVGKEEADPTTATRAGSAFETFTPPGLQ